MILAGMALARDVDLKVHDAAGTLSGDVTVRLVGPGGEATFTCRDDGATPDAVPADHIFTARAEALVVENGQVEVASGAERWAGGFAFDAASDPVLLVSLEDGGLAIASTREMIFLPDRDPGATPTSDAAPTQRFTLPEGMVVGWIVGAISLFGIGALAIAAARRPARLPPIVGGRATTTGRGPLVKAAGDLHLGSGDTPAIGPGRWTPEEIALAALAQRATRIVVHDPGRIECRGDPEAALARALSGVADLWWVDSGTRS